MKTIGIFTSEQGHKSMADAILEKILISKKYKVKKFHSEAPLNFIYKTFYKFSPKIWGKSFYASTKLLNKNQEINQLVDNYLKNFVEEEVVSFVEKNKIDLAISTHFLYNKILTKFQKEKNIPYFNIIPDPRTIHSIYPVKDAKLNFIFDENVPKNSIKDCQTKISGWFVRKRFEDKFDLEKLRKELKVKKDELNFLIVSGSEGSNMVLKLLPSIINCEKKINFFIACGRNKILFKNIVGIKKSVEKLSSSQAKIIPLAFTKEIHKYMQIADLVIGKAGPNTLFESVACETPFFATTHMIGQEDGNLEIIKDYNLGFVEEKAKKANKKLSAIIKNPEILDKFSKDLKKMKKYNQNSINILLKEIDKALEN